jgi:chromosome segregation ATPase
MLKTLKEGIMGKQENNAGGVRLSHKAAAVAQEMENLESELSEALNRAQQMENRASVAESTVERMEEELKTSRARHETEIVNLRVNKDSEIRALREDRDYYQERFIQVKEKLKSSASIILECLREDKADVREAYRPRSESLRAVARAVGQTEEDEPPKQIPSFLSAGPKPDERE